MDASPRERRPFLRRSVAEAVPAAPGTDFAAKAIFRAVGAIRPGSGVMCPRHGVLRVLPPFRSIPAPILVPSGPPFGVSRSSRPPALVGGLPARASRESYTPVLLKVLSVFALFFNGLRRFLRKNLRMLRKRLR